MKKLDDSTRIPFPTIEKWGEYYTDWHDSLVDALGSRHQRSDREDAVTAAFLKLMKKKKGAYQHVPETEKEWWGCLLWQAKASLRHFYESQRTREEYHKKAALEQLINAPCTPCCGLDGDIRRSAAFMTLETVCRAAGVKARNMEGYIRWYLFRENCATVARELKTTTGNLHVARYRIEELLEKHGRRVYCQLRNGMFREAA